MYGTLQQLHLLLQSLPLQLRRGRGAAATAWPLTPARVGPAAQLMYGTLEEFGIGVVRPAASIANLCGQAR